MAVAPLRNYLCLFAQQHPEFRLPELLSLASLAKAEIKFDPKSYSTKNPLLLVQLPSEEYVHHITRRSLLIKSMFELWGWGRDHEELESAVKRLPAHITEPYSRPDYTFKVVTRAFSRKCSMERQRQLHERLSYLPLAGKVDLSCPNHEFHFLEDFGNDPNEAPKEPYRMFLGRLISHGQRKLIHRYSVKERYFIGNTSMDAQLSLIMANFAQVKEGSLVFDPFAGTGSLLVASAHFGGYVVGGDIDYPLLHGRGKAARATAGQKWRSKDESVLSNLRQYGLERYYVDMLVSDAARSAWRRAELFDAIITDPPYGIREGGRKLGSRKATPTPVAPEYQEDHIPAVCNYRPSDLFADLLDFAAQHLILGGRLVYWLPVILTDFSAELVPTHPCLRLLASCEQPLQRHVGRRLIVMEKCRAWSAELQRRAVSSREHDCFRKKYFSDAARDTPLIEQSLSANNQQR